MFRYEELTDVKSRENFISDLTHNLQREIVFDATMRVRTSIGSFVSAVAEILCCCSVLFAIFSSYENSE